MRVFFLIVLSCMLLACASKQGASEIGPASTVSATSFNAADYVNKAISVTIEKGTVDFHNIDGFWAYQPIVVVLKNGDTVTKSLTKAGDNFFDSNAKITFRYYNGLLYIDEVFRKDAGFNYPGVKFTLEQDWLSAKLYKNVNTYGLSNLRNAQITVRIN